MVAVMDYLGVQLGTFVSARWTSVRVTRSLEQAAASFECLLSEQAPGRDVPELFVPGDPCTITLGLDVVISGFIDTYAPSFASDAHSVQISGRSRTADFVDASAVVPGGQLKNLTVLQIAQQLAKPFGIPVTATVDVGKPIPVVQVQQGETCHALLERLCRMQGLLVSDGPGGGLQLTRAGSQRSTTALVQGENIWTGRAELTVINRFSEYTVKGQRPGTDDGAAKDAAQVKGSANDSGVSRHRPLILTAESIVDPDGAQRRAAWEARRRMGQAVSAEIGVTGWRQDNGSLWQVNQLVPVYSPWLGLDQDLLVSQVEFSAGAREGTTTTLTLVQPDAFLPEQPATDTVASGQKPDAKGIMWASGTGNAGVWT
jgi:prophage tail gpP-like protein